jgi:hypothetical protein
MLTGNYPFDQSPEVRRLHGVDWSLSLPEYLSEDVQDLLWKTYPYIYISLSFPLSPSLSDIAAGC